MDDPSRLGVYFLDVGQGDCSFIVPPGGERAILVDCKDAYVAERFVEDHRIVSLPAVVVSHLDRDHIQGMLPFLRNFIEQGHSVGSVYVSFDRDLSELTQAAENLIAAVLKWDEERVLGHGRPERDGRPKRLLEGVDWWVDLILPRTSAVVGMRLDGREEPNPSSAVLRVVRSDKSILIGGDAPLHSWMSLERDLFEASVVRTPHHCGDIRERGEPWDHVQELYDKISPELAVVSAGTRNSHHHPLREHLDAIRRDGRRILCTQLTQRCHRDPQGLREQALRQASGVTWPYRHRVQNGDATIYRPRNEVPCAGSMVVWITTRGVVEVEPGPDEWHDRFLLEIDEPGCRAV